MKRAKRVGDLPARPEPLPMDGDLVALVERRLSAHLAGLNRRLDDQVAAAQRRADEDRSAVEAIIEAQLDELAQRSDGLLAASELYLQERITLDTDLIAQRVDALAKRAATTQAQIDAKHHEVDAALRQLEAVQQQAAAEDEALRADVDRRLGGLTVMIAAAQDAQQQSDLAARELRDAFDAFVTRVDDRLDELTDRLDADRDSAAAMSGALEQALDDQRERIDILTEAAAETSAAIRAEVAAMAEQLADIDETDLDKVRADISTAVGEVTLLRIEMDRYTTSSDEKFDRTQLRIADIEAQLNNDMDTEALVQLERLDSLERAVAELDPDQFVRREEAAPSLHASGITAITTDVLASRYS